MGRSVRLEEEEAVMGWVVGLVGSGWLPPPVCPVDDDCLLACLATRAERGRKGGRGGEEGFPHLGSGKERGRKNTWYVVMVGKRGVGMKEEAEEEGSTSGDR